MFAQGFEKTAGIFKNLKDKATKVITGKVKAKMEKVLSDPKTMESLKEKSEHIAKDPLFKALNKKKG